MTIGHNQPPALEAMSLHCEDLFSLVSGSVASPVTTDEQEAALDTLLDDVRKARKDADAARAAEKKVHDEAAKAIQSAWKPLLDRYDKASEAIKEALTPYRTAKQKAKDAAAAAALAEAKAKQEVAIAALRKSDDLEAKFAAEIALEDADKRAARASQISRAPTGLRTYYTAEITDRKAALRHYLGEQPEMFVLLIQDLADKDARSPATRRDIPGIAFHENKRAA